MSVMLASAGSVVLNGRSCLKQYFRLQVHPSGRNRKLVVEPASLGMLLTQIKEKAMSSSRFTVVLTAAVTLCLVAAVNIFSSHLNRTKVDDCLPGDWTFMCVPNNASAAKASEVKVVRVGSDKSKGAAIVHVLVMNRGDRGIRGVALHWSLAKDASAPHVLLEGNTARFDLSIPPGNAEEVEDIGVSFARLQRQLPAQALAGDFKLTIGVAEVLYEDGKWQPPPVAKRAMNVKAAMAPCANLGCVLNEIDHSLLLWTELRYFLLVSGGHVVFCRGLPLDGRLMTC
jgi:hypothetical protein